MHPLLARQLRKALGQAPGPELERLVAMVDAAYIAADADRAQLERSLLLASDELYAQNRKLERELAERKRLEVELQGAEKLRAVGMLAAGVAHEINTPIQFVGDGLTFLVDAFGEIEHCLGRIADRPGVAAALADDEVTFVRAQVPGALGRCREGIERVAVIVRALKNFAYPGGHEQHLADLHAAIENTLIVVANELRFVADVELDLQATAPVRCHVGEFQQVLLNLLVNAGHAIVDRFGESDGRGAIQIATHEDGPDFVMKLADNGAGIPLEIRQRIFEPFFTTKAVGDGTGLGLSVTWGIVREHGGWIDVDSQPGKGSTFTVYLPAGAV
jgi:signal transduction histidine kinase